MHLKGTTIQKILKPKTKQTAILRPVEDIVVEVFGNYPDGEYDPYDPDSWDEFDEGQEIEVNILGTFKETKPFKGNHTVLQCELIDGGGIAEFPKHLVSIKKVQEKLKSIPRRLHKKSAAPKRPAKRKG